MNEQTTPITANPSSRGLQSGPAVSIVIPCRNEERFIEDCIRGVLAFDDVPGGYEVIVADGLSDDGTRDILARLVAADGRIRVVDNPARRTPSGLNAAIRAARGAVILRVDAHTIYDRAYLAECVAALGATGAANVGGPWVAVGVSRRQRAIAAAFASPFAVGGARGHRDGYEGPTDTVYLGCWPRATFDRFGLFDEELVRNQDDEHNLRIAKAGGLIWQSPAIRSWYAPRASLTALFRQYFQYGYWKVRVLQLHGRHASWRHVVPGVFVLALLVLALGSFEHPLDDLLFLLAAAYLGADVLASILAARRSGWDVLPWLLTVFPCYHFGYGLGYLAGVWDFMLLRRTGRATALTR